MECKKKLQLDLKRIFRQGLNRDIPSEELTAWIDNLYYRNLHKGEFFLCAGEKCTDLALILKGGMRLYYIDFQGNEVTKYFAAENEILLTTAALAKVESPYYIEAISECELLVGNCDQIMQATSKNLFWMQIFNVELVKQIVYKEHRECSFLMETATERYEKFLRDYPEKGMLMRQKDIASYLGISPESLSRIRRELNLT